MLVLRNNMFVYWLCFNKHVCEKKFNKSKSKTNSKLLGLVSGPTLYCSVLVNLFVITFPDPKRHFLQKYFFCVEGLDRVIVYKRLNQ